MRYTDVVFDIDGTLIDSTRAIRAGLDDLALELVGRRLTPQEAALGNGLPAGPALERIGLPGDGGTQERWIRNLLAHWDEVVVFDGVPEVLAGLARSGVRLGAVTAETRSEMERGFATFDVSRLLAHVVVAEDTERHKPDPEPLESYLAWSGADAGDVLYVGDGLVDAECAQAAGVDFALAAWRPHPLGRGVGEVARLEEPRQVLELI
ncbi:MAG: HAD hydrolase-like protein [Olsenella sp.]|nr:HAD hydrolase-like protein [Olsenella sp.]